MSNIDKMTANEQLFTELTPEEGAVVEGGFGVLHIHKIKAINAGADPWPPGNPDDTYIKVNGLEVWGKHGMKKNWIKTVNFRDIYEGSIDVQLWDSDWPSADDYLGGFTALPEDNFLGAPKIVSGSGSKYAVYYRA